MKRKEQEEEDSISEKIIDVIDSNLEEAIRDQSDDEILSRVEEYIDHNRSDWLDEQGDDFVSEKMEELRNMDTAEMLKEIYRFMDKTKVKEALAQGLGKKDYNKLIAELV